MNRNHHKADFEQGGDGCAESTDATGAAIHRVKQQGRHQRGNARRILTSRITLTRNACNMITLTGFRLNTDVGGESTTFACLTRPQHS